MSEPTTDPQLDEFLEIRKPGAHLEEGVVADDFVLMLGVDLVNFPKFPRVDDNVTYPKAGLDIRQRARRRLRRGAPRLQRAVPGRPALHRLLEGGARHQVPAVERAYLQLCVDGWATEVAKRYGAETMAEIEWTAWNDQIVPELERMRNEFLPAGHRLRRPEPARRSERPRDDTRRLHRTVHARARTRSSSPRSSSSRGSSGVTSTCCSASRRGPRRSSCATGST